MNWTVHSLPATFSQDLFWCDTQACVMDSNIFLMLENDEPTKWDE